MSLLGDIGNNIANGWNSLMDPGKQARETVASIDKGQALMDTAWKNATAKPATPAYVPPSYQQSADSKAATNAIYAQIAADNARFAAQPKLIYRDTNAAWQNAQNTAATSVNPVYSDYLNNFMTKQANALSQTTAQTGVNKTASDTNLVQTNQDIATSGERTAQDTASAIAQNRANETNWQTSEGNTNTAAEDQARLALGDQGIMGRGAGQLDTSKIARNAASDLQTTNFANERDTKTLLESRTFADLATKGTRATEQNVTEKANLDRQLTDFIVNQGTDLTGFKSTNEQARLDALGTATTSQYRTDTANWLSSLQGKQRAQDIALATQIYGGR